MAVIDLVKWDNTRPDIFAYKFGSEKLSTSDQLSTWTRVIVNESQEAILFKSGKALDTFGAGVHVLDTENIPLLREFMKLPFGGRTPFPAEVWYINKAFNLDIKWGTPTPIQLSDPKYNIFIPVSAYGQFGITIRDARKFLIKLVGTMTSFDAENIRKYFRGLYLTKVKDSISSYLIHKQVSIMEINAYLDELSTHLKERIEDVMQEYGIGLLNFYVNDISVPENDPAVIQLKASLSKKADMNIIGYSYTEERSFNTLNTAAANPGAAASAPMNVGMGLQLGTMMANQFGGMVNTLNTTPQPAPPAPAPAPPSPTVKSITCTACNVNLGPSDKFCPECGKKYIPCAQCSADLPDGASSCTQCGNAPPSPCPGCGHMLEKKTNKFCPECGVTLVKKCRACSHTIEGSPKFCPECGEGL